MVEVVEEKEREEDRKATAMVVVEAVVAFLFLPFVLAGPFLKVEQSGP